MSDVIRGGSRAAESAVSVLCPGQENADGGLVEVHSIVIATLDDGFVVEGTPEELYEFGKRVLTAAAWLYGHAADGTAGCPGD